MPFKSIHSMNTFKGHEFFILLWFIKDNYGLLFSMAYLKLFSMMLK